MIYNLLYLLTYVTRGLIHDAGLPIKIADLEVQIGRSG